MPDDPTPDPDQPSRTDLKLWEQALRGDWPIPPAIKRRLLQVAINLVEPGDPIDLDAKDDKGQPLVLDLGDRVRLQAVTDRTKLAALRVIVQFSRQSIEQQRLDLERRKAEGGPEVTETETADPIVAAAALRAASEARHDRHAEGDPQHPADDARPPG